MKIFDLFEYSTHETRDYNFLVCSQGFMRVVDVHAIALTLNPKPLHWKGKKSVLGCDSNIFFINV